MGHHDRQAEEDFRLICASYERKNIARASQNETADLHIECDSILPLYHDGLASAVTLRWAADGPIHVRSAWIEYIATLIV
jgi:hypothetical protein